MQFPCVYINEAHADDEWPIRTLPALQICAHHTLEERCAALAAWGGSCSEEGGQCLEERCSGDARLEAGRYTAETGSAECTTCLTDDTGAVECERCCDGGPARHRGSSHYILQPRTKHDEGTAVASYYDFRDLEEALESCALASHTTQDTVED